MGVPSHRTLAGDELDYPEPAEDDLAQFLERVRDAADDPEVDVDGMTALIYSADNPLLGPSASPVAAPERGTASAETWASPSWHVMLDLLEAKRISVAETTPSLRLAEAGELLDLTEDAVRKAILAGTLDGQKRANRWYVTPGSVATYRDRVLRRGRWPSSTPLRFRAGREGGFSMAVKSLEKGTKKRVRQGVVEVTLPEYERVVVRLRWQDGEGRKARRVLVLEHDPSAEPYRYDWPPNKDGPGFFIEGRFRIVDKINNPAKASAAWREIKPA